MKVHYYPKLLMLGCLLWLTGCGGGENPQSGADSDKSTVSADASQSNASQENEVVEFTEGYERMFAPRKPKVGDVVEGISAYDEDGEAFDLGQLRGKPTVIVFGCLT